MSLCKTIFFSAKTGIRLSFFLHRKTDRVPENTLSENTPSVFVVLVLILFCTENPVSCISQTRADICVFVQLTIHMTYVDLHVRMSLMQRSRPSGAAIINIHLIFFPPCSLIKSTAATAEPPVASMGSVTTISL